MVLVGVVLVLVWVGVYFEHRAVTLFMSDPQLMHLLLSLLLLLSSA